MEIEVDIKQVRNFIKSEKFSDFLLSNTTEFSTAAFILQVLLEKLDEIESKE